MLVTFRTILNDDGTIKFKRESAHISKYCCDSFESWAFRNVREKEVIQYPNEPYTLILTCGESQCARLCDMWLDLRYCPICGKKIEFKEIGVFRLKRVEKEKTIKEIEYVTEEVK